MKFSSTSAPALGRSSMRYLAGWVILGLLLSLVWGCNEEAYVEPVRYTSIRGKVIFNDTRKAVSKALVRLSPTSRSIETDSAGNFRFDSVSAGKYTLQTTVTGYVSEFAAIEITDQQTSAVTIVLRSEKSQNQPPTAPVAITPKTGSDTLKTTLTLRWKATDPNRDSLTYDVALFQDGITTPIMATSAQKTDSLQLKNLNYNTTYYWQVTANDGVNSVKSAVFTFRTRAFPDLPYVYVKRISNRLQILSSNGPNNEIQLTTQGSNWRPVVSPNRNEIAFISNANTDLHLFVMNRNGSNLRQVTAIPLAGIVPTDLSFCWSPDGTQLVYPANDKLYIIQANGTGLRILAKIPAGLFFSGCDWTQQGNQIVARISGTEVYGNQLLLVNPQTGAYKLAYETEGRVSNPVFSVDGKQVLFGFDVSLFKNEQGRQLDARVHLLTLASSAVVDLTGNGKANGTNDLDPRFSPNGAKIILTNADNTGNGTRGLYVMDANGQNRTALITQAEMAYWR
jgi:TolB protein